MNKEAKKQRQQVFLAPVVRVPQEIVSWQVLSNVGEVLEEGTSEPQDNQGAQKGK